MFRLFISFLIVYICDARNLLLKEKGIHHLRDDYIRQTQAFDKTATHKVVFAIKQNNMDRLTELLMDVSDPSSSRYGQYLNRDEVASMTANMVAEEAVVTYLKELQSTSHQSSTNTVHIQNILEPHGAASSAGRKATTTSSVGDSLTITRSTYGEYITAEAPVHLWERAFDTSFHVFKHADSDTAVVRALSYSLPEEVHMHVSTVFNTVQLPGRKQMNSQFASYSSGSVSSSASSVVSNSELSENGVQSQSQSQSQSQNQSQSQRMATQTTSTTSIITPSVLRTYYGIPSEAQGSSTISQSCFESRQDFSPRDLSVYQTLNGLSNTPILRDYGGHEDNSLCYDGNIDIALAGCSQANLNVQTIMGLAPSSPTIFWYQFSYIQDVFVEWIHDVASLAVPPLVHSVTYGVDELEVDIGVSDEFNNLMVKLGVIGVTVLVQSGENGVNSQYGRCGFYPSFPATSPYVTVVGATQGVESGAPEIACQSNKGGVTTSGGGFSELNDQPSYQDAAVAAWRALCNNETACGQGTVATGIYSGQYVSYGGRAYPDLSLAGHNYQIVVGGLTYLVSGTAASTPAVAAMVTLVNANRSAVGQAPVGFMNPTLYSTSVVFTNDITEGSNQCLSDESGGTCCSSGFNATVGWDPVTGLGSVNYAQFVTIFPDAPAISRLRVRTLYRLLRGGDSNNDSAEGNTFMNSVIVWGQFLVRSVFSSLIITGEYFYSVLT